MRRKGPKTNTKRARFPLPMLTRTATLTGLGKIDASKEAEERYKPWTVGL